MNFGSFKKWYKHEIGKFGTLIILVIIAIAIITLYYIFFVDSGNQLSGHILQIPEKSQEYYACLTAPDA